MALPSVWICSRVFDSSVGAHVRPSYRELTELELKRTAKTRRAKELKVVRQAAFQDYRKKFESLLRAKERLTKLPCTCTLSLS